MTDPLLTRPEFQEAVEAAVGFAKPERCDRYGDDHGPHNCGDCSRLWAWDNATDTLTAALPFIRKALAEELRAEAKRRGEGDWYMVVLSPVYTFGLAADFIEEGK